MSDNASTPHPYVAARAVLTELYAHFLQLGHRSWRLGRPTEAAEFDKVKLAPDDAWKAMRTLVEKDLAEYMGTAGVRISQFGVEICDHGRIDDVLPLPRIDAGRERIQLEGGVVVEELERELAFVRDGELRSMLVRDLEELRQALDVGLTKAAVLLCGSIMEAALLDVVGRRPDLAKSFRQKKKNFPDDFSLIDFLEIAIEVGILPTSIKGMASAVIDHRDLIHPAAERRREVRLDSRRAGAMVSFLAVVLQDLNAASAAIQTYESR